MQTSRVRAVPGALSRGNSLSTTSSSPRCPSPAFRRPLVPRRAAEGEPAPAVKEVEPEPIDEELSFKTVGELLEKSMEIEIDTGDPSSGDAVDQQALDIMKQLKDAGVVVGLEGARQTPKREYTLEELRLNKIEAEKLLAPTDDTLNGVRDKLQIALALGAASAVYFAHWGPDELLTCIVAGIFFLGVDQVATGGGLESILMDSAGRVLAPSYPKRVALHESGHFLIAYLLGLMPKAYTLSAWDAASRYGALNLQAGCRFCDSAFNREVQSGKLTSSSLDRYTCVALAGVATEYIHFGRAEGGMADVQQLDGLLTALQFTQAKADSEIRWAVLNTITLLRRHRKLHIKLANAMLQGVSTVECVRLIERELKGLEDI